MESPLITLNSVTKIYNTALEKKAVTAVDDLSFTVQSGGITGFAGPNGAGKTTSIKMILGLIGPTKGTVTLMGESSGSTKSREKISYVSEQPYFYEHLTAEETLRFICQLNKIPKNRREKEISIALKKVELDHRKKAKVKTFSKGMQQRLNMAQAILGSPELIIMDEPMSGLDPLGRRLFRTIFRELADSGVTIFFSTHIIEDIESLCDRVVVLSNGQLKYSGDIKELIDASTLGIEYHFTAQQAEKLPDINKLKDLTVSHISDGSLTISTRSSANTLIPVLKEAGIFPNSIIPIRRSLEEILYDKKETE